MRGLCLSLAVLGIFSLLCYSYVSPAEFRFDDLPGKHVFYSGLVIQENEYADMKYLKLGDVEIICKCDGLFLNKNVRVEGFVENYNGLNRIRAHTILVE